MAKAHLRPRGTQARYRACQLGRLNHQTGADTTSANANSAYLTVFADMANRLQVGIPQALRLIVGVAHVVADVGDFSTEITFPAHGKASFLFKIGWRAARGRFSARSPVRAFYYHSKVRRASSFELIHLDVFDASGQAPDGLSRELPVPVVDLFKIFHKTSRPVSYVLPVHAVYKFFQALKSLLFVPV